MDAIRWAKTFIYLGYYQSAAQQLERARRLGFTEVEIYTALRQH